MSQIHREALTKFDKVTLDYQMPVWKEGGNKDATLKRITLRDFFASDVISTVIDPPNWATEGLTVVGSHTHNFGANTITLDGGTHVFGSSLTFSVNGSMFMPSVVQDDSLTKLAVFDSSTGEIKWKDSSTLSGNYFDKTSDDTDDITEGVNKFVTAAHLTKLGHISVSQAVDLDQMESDIAVNNNKVSNIASNLSEGTFTNTTVNVNSSDGTSATLQPASTSRAGVLTKALFDEIAVNTAKDVSGIAANTANIATNAAGLAGLGSYVSAVQANTATNATAIALNTVKVTNATHTGEVTGSVGSTALIIADGVVDGANLKVSNSATNGYVLTSRPGTTEGLTWEAASIGNTDLSLSGSVSTLNIGSSTGSGVTLPAASSSIAGLLTSANLTKLNGIENLAEVNPTDSEIETSYNSQVPEVTQAEAEAGTVTTVKRWTPERVKQAIDALAGGTPSLTNGEVFVGNSSNAANSVPMTGDVQIAVNGATTIQPDSVTYSKMQDVSQACMLGKTSSGVGQVSEIPIIEQYISNTSATAILLDNTSNWNVNGVYGGSTIAGTYQGQNHVNPNYWFTATDDDVWIRLIRG